MLARTTVRLSWSCPRFTKLVAKMRKENYGRGAGKRAVNALRKCFIWDHCTLLAAQNEEHHERHAVFDAVHQDAGPQAARLFAQVAQHQRQDEGVDARHP